MRAALIGVGLVGAALLIALDRSVIAPYWRRPTTTSPPTAAQDRAQYHHRQFAVTRVVDGDTIRIDAPEANDSSTRSLLKPPFRPKTGSTPI